MFIVAPMGERIRLLRKQKGITQIQLSEKAGIGVASLIRYEKGERTPNLEILRKLADALEVPIAYLISGSLAPVTITEDNNGIIEFVPGVPDDVAQLVGLSSDNKAQLLEAFDRLNEEGQNKAVERVEELTEIPKYKK